MLAFIGWLILLVFLILLSVILLAAAVLGVVLPSLSLRASCSVADVKEPAYFVSFPLGYAVVLTYVALCWLCVLYIGRFDVDPDAPFGSMHLCGYLLALASGWVLASLAYRAVVAPTFLKGFWVAGLQLLLCGLATALAAAVLMTTLSVCQLMGLPLPGVTAPRPATAQAAPAVVAAVDPS